MWLAAAASREDCELACDERTVRTLGEEENLAYGQTLVELVRTRQNPGELGSRRPPCRWDAGASRSGYSSSLPPR